MKKTRIVLYLLCIVLANVLTASSDPIVWGKFIVPVGSFLIGATFILRDLVQNAIGRRNTYIAIGAAMLLSAGVSFALGNTLWITFASAITFLFSETTDTEIYTRLKLPLSLKVLYSGIVGGALDSVVFVIIGLSPIGAGFLPWEMVGYAIVGQIIVKTVMQLLGSGVIQLVPGSKKVMGA